MKHRLFYTVLAATTAAIMLVSTTSSTAWALGLSNGSGSGALLGSYGSGSSSSPPAPSPGSPGSPGRQVPYVPPPSPSPPPPPPAWIYVGSSAYGTGYAPNPICQTGTVKCNNQIPPGCQEAGGYGGVGLVCPGTQPSPPGNVPGAEYGWVGDPIPLYVTRWQVNYGGHTYTYGGSPNLDTGWTIPVVCTGAPTSGTVSYWINNPGTPPPPPGWSWGAGPGSPWTPLPPPPSGPYTASFTVPACPAGPLTPKLVPGRGPDLENNDAVDENGNFFTFWVHPVPNKQGYQLVNSSHGMVCYDSGYATIGPSSYLPTVTSDLADGYPRWQFSIHRHITPYSVVQNTYQDPQLIVQNDCGAVTNHDYASSPDVGVDMAFHAPTNKGNPYRLTIHARYTAYWGVWYMRVQASSSATQSSVPAPIWKDVPYRYYGKKCPHKICTGMQAVSETVGYYTAAFQDPPAEASSLPIDTAHQSYDLSTTLHIAVVAPLTVFANGLP